MSPLHVAIIMDGNGRWASARGLPRAAGHARGADALRRVVEAAPALGVTTLTAFAFSADNWKRPAAEEGALFDLFSSYLDREVESMRRAGVRLSVIGRRDRLSQALREQVGVAEAGTEHCQRIHVRLAIDYSARDAIVHAAMAAMAGGPLTRERITQFVGSGCGRPDDAGDVDLLIRTGGEQRLSDFLLWECAYAELWFTPTAWPDFGAGELEHALTEFRGRERRFGAIPAAAS